MFVFRESLSVCVCTSFSFGFDAGMWDLIVLIPDHCLSIYFSSLSKQEIGTESSNVLHSVNMPHVFFLKLQNFALKMIFFWQIQDGLTVFVSMKT